MPDRDEQAILDELQVKLIDPGQKGRWNRLVRQHHYLKSSVLVGEQLRYVVTDGRDQWLALLGWSAPALHLKARDQSIEWTGRTAGTAAYTCWRRTAATLSSPSVMSFPI